MKTILTIFLFIAINANGINYYVKTGGSDAANGLSDATAWATISKVNSSSGSFSTGDSVLFKRGDSFAGTIVQGGNRVVIGAYGTGEKPVLDGLTTLTSWTNLGGGLYEKSVSGSPSSVNMLVYDGIPIPYGRYPKANAANGGYLTIASHTGTSSVTAVSNLSGSGFIGGQVVIRKSQYVIDKGTITSHSGLTVGYTPDAESTGDQPINGFGFFIQNHIDCVTQYKDWSYNPSTGKVTFFFGAENPNSHTVQISTTEYLSTNTNFGIGLYYDNIHFRGANSYAVYNNNGAAGIRFTNCDIEYSGIDAIHNTNTGIGAVTFINGTINYSNNNGITANGTEVDVSGSVIRNTGTMVGMGSSGGGMQIAIRWIGANSLIENNQVINTGYIGIHFVETNNVTIQYNLVDTFCTVKDDGGGIYSFSGSPTANTGRVIYQNIVRNGIGNTTGTTSALGLAFGIYMDDRVAGVLVRNNTAYNCSYTGFYLHNTNNITLDSNTFYNNHYAQSDYVDDDAGSTMNNLSVQRNLLYSTIDTQYLISAANSVTSLSGFGTINNNWYYRPTAPTTSYAYVHGPCCSQPTFTQWKATTNQDAATIGTAPAYVTTTNDSLFTNPTNSPVTLSSTRKWQDNYGNIYDGSVPLQKYQGLLLWDVGAATTGTQFFKIRGRIIN